MAQTTAEQRLLFPLPAYNFRVDVAGVGMSFATVSGIALEQGHVTYRHGFSYIEGEEITQYRHEEFAPITMTRGTVIGVEELRDWLTEGDLRNMDVSLCDEVGAPVVTWHIAKAVPVKVSAPTYDATTNDVAIDTLEVMAAGITIEHTTGS